MDANRTVFINKLDEEGYAPLHRAIILDDINMLNEVLNYLDCNPDLRNHKDESPLMMCLLRERSSAFMAQLLDRGCDPNIRDKYQPYLHQSTFDRMFNNMDTTEGKGETALLYAVNREHMENVCMLLCYGADVTVVNAKGLTPLMVAISQNATSIAKVLMDFYEDFSHRDFFNGTALLYACESTNPLAYDLLKLETDIDKKPDYLAPLVLYSLKFPTADLFKQLWSKINFDEIPDLDFLLIYMQRSNFQESDWLDVLMLILVSPIGFDALHYATNIFYYLFDRFAKFNTSVSIRMGVINLCLSMSAEVHVFIIKAAVKQFGFGPEVEALIYNLDQPDPHIFTSPVLNHLFDLKLRLFYDPLHKYKPILTKKTGIIRDWLSYHSPLGITKEKLKSLVNEQNSECLQTISASFPSLMELGRDAVCHVIRRNAVITKPYQFYDAIKSLDVPPYIKDVLIFKQPIPSMLKNATYIDNNLEWEPEFEFEFCDYF